MPELVVLTHDTAALVVGPGGGRNSDAALLQFLRNPKSENKGIHGGTRTLERDQALRNEKAPAIAGAKHSLAMVARCKRHEMRFTLHSGGRVINQLIPFTAERGRGTTAM